MMNLKVLANKKIRSQACLSWFGLCPAYPFYMPHTGFFTQFLVIVFCFPLGFTQLSCSHVNFVSDSDILIEKNVSPTIQAITVLPKHFSYRKLYFSDTKTVLASRDLLNLASISRPKVEVRDGPGIEFILLDKILENGEMVIVFDSKGVWKKIHTYKSNITGWVHEKTIKKLGSSGDKLALNLKFMPTVIAIKKLNFIHSYPDKKRIKVRIRKGAQFIALKKSYRSTLVWIGETNSVAWLSKKFVH